MNDQTDTRPTFETIVDQAITIIRYSETGDERRIEAFRQITKIARIADRLSRDEVNSKARLAAICHSRA